MKRICCLLLIPALLTACGAEAGPTVRYENDAAYYEQEGAELSMELSFAEPVVKDSVITLLNGETAVLSLTVESETKTLTLRSDKLEKNVAYTLTVNGVMQQHAVQSLQPPEPMEDIPDQPTIPVEPMGEEPLEESVSGFTPGAGTLSPMGEPPEGIGEPPEGMSAPSEALGERPDIDLSLTPPDGEQPPEPPGGLDGKQPPNNEISANFDPCTFMITSENPRFTDVCNAVEPEGKEPNT